MLARKGNERQFSTTEYFFAVRIEHSYEKIKFLNKLFAKPIYIFRNVFLGIINSKMIPNIIR